MSVEQRAALEVMARSESLPFRRVRQARGLLLAADGTPNEAIARRVGVKADTVRAWRKRFSVEGVRVIRPGRGRPPVIGDEVVEQIVSDTLHARPPDGSTHWSTRTMAARYGVGKGTVARVWKARGLRPWRTETLKLSNDPHFEEKLVDVVGLYMDPPERAVVLCVDEKSQIQALERSQRSLPLKPGRAGTLTHDYRRHGTTTLFAALDTATGRIIADCRPRHRHQEFLAFLKLIERHVPQDLDVHLVIDNYAAHKHANVTRWLEHLHRRERWHIHYTPTSASWLNLVERWFRELTQKRLRRDSFRQLHCLVTPRRSRDSLLDSLVGQQRMSRAGWVSTLECWTVEREPRLPVSSGTSTNIAATEIGPRGLRYRSSRRRKSVGQIVGQTWKFGHLPG